MSDQRPEFGKLPTPKEISKQALKSEAEKPEHVDSYNKATIMAFADLILQRSERVGGVAGGEVNKIIKSEKFEKLTFEEKTKILKVYAGNLDITKQEIEAEALSKF